MRQIHASTPKPARSSRGGEHGAGTMSGIWVLAFGLTSIVLCGYAIFVYSSRALVLSPGAKTPIVLQLDPQALSISATHAKTTAKPESAFKHKWPGHTIHSIHTSSGDSYMSIQSRIMYASYKLIQKMPGGERHTGFTRILHRTIPDLLMDEIPTFWAFPYHRTDCDYWCDYPPIMRPHALQAFFDAARKNESMIQGAWIFMVEDDYVWMQPMQVPGSAWDPDVPAVQFLYTYIKPQAPHIAVLLKKLYAGPASDIPASGASPVLMRQHEWEIMVPEFTRVLEAMEKDEDIKKRIGWVREMYAWDVAVAHHKEINFRNELPVNTTTLIQPPFDDELGNAALCHYTWGALFHDKPPSQNATVVYKFEKRDWLTIEQMIKIAKVPMPPEFQEGWYLQFDTPVTRKRYDLIVRMLTQINAAIDTLPDLTQKWHDFQPLRQKYKLERDAKVAKLKAEAEAAKGSGSQGTKEIKTSNPAAQLPPSRRRVL